ncbi:MAG TPA: glycosyltransferase family 2 protein [Granulicella sp.]|jgi:glycosyltransferase involved in cell wall biosynthesis|nr:glycosyltransferase family 2 protein [Granulicella sp.]
MTAHHLEVIETIAEVIVWITALCWAFHSFIVVRGLPRVPDLLLQPNVPLGLGPDPAPTLTVIVPACNEEAHVAAALLSLIAQDYPNLDILAINDRSSDQTGAILDALAAQHPTRLRVLHITELPAGWLGKTHAMALAARNTTSDYLLFTDADVLFTPDALRRSVSYLVKSGGDHLVTYPSLIIRRWDEAVVLGFIQVSSLWGARPWRVSDPRARRDAIGVGAFNLVKHSAYEQVGGFEALRMEVVEDLGLGRRLKADGFAARLAFGRGLVNIHWASGALGLAHVLTKNIFSALRFRISLVLVACLWLLAFCVAPFAALWIELLRLPALIILLAVTLEYRAMSRQSGIAPWNALLMPFGALLLVYALLRSMLVTLVQGGIRWRGTFYPLSELRRNSAPVK